MNTKSLRNRYNELRTRYDKAAGAMDAATEKLATYKADATAYAEATEIAQNIAAAIQNNAHAQISNITTRCLGAVFDDPYEFEILFETKRNKTEANLQFTRYGNPINPLGASGGGVVDLAAFALRVAALRLSRPEARPVLILDEPFKFVSAEYRPAVRAMLEALAEDLGMQYIMITHIPELICGNTIELSG